VNVARPVLIEFSIRISGGSTADLSMFDRAGWQGASYRLFASFSADGRVYAEKDLLGTYTSGQWIRLRVRYARLTEQTVEMTY